MPRWFYAAAVPGGVSAEFCSAQTALVHFLPEQSALK
jgi:hypothetical protein